jgi:hypothetical protein
LKKPYWDILSWSPITGKIHHLVEQADFAGADFERKEYRKALTRIQMADLHRYQAKWLAERRDLRIINRGKKDLGYLESNACTHALALIMPDLPCIAATMSSAESLSFASDWSLRSDCWRSAIKTTM